MPTGNTGFVFNLKVSNVNMSVPKNNFQGNISILRLKSVCFCHFRGLKSDCWTLRRLLCDKSIKLFRMCGV